MKYFGLCFHHKFFKSIVVCEEPYIIMLICSLKSENNRSTISFNPDLHLTLKKEVPMRLQEDIEGIDAVQECNGINSFCCFWAENIQAITPARFSRKIH